MIHGIGTDIVAVKRLQRMWERHGERVLEKLLAPQELAEFAHAAVAAKGRFLAKRFAAKEAFCKALGTGLRPPAVLPAIAVGHDELGKPELAKIRQAGQRVRELGMRFNAGHALNYYNVQAVARLAGVRELHIGNAIVSRAVFVGLREAVREMKQLMREAAERGE